MSKAEIIAELPYLKADELAEVQAKLDELLGESWLDNGELNSHEKNILDSTLAEYQKNPHGGSTWNAAKTRIESRLL